VLNWLRGKRKRPAPLAGAPAMRRRKTYSASSGWVYQYHYEGSRPAGEPVEAPGTEFVFHVSADRKTSFPISVFVSEAALAPWQRARGRELTANERYAVAKLALFEAFDRRADPAAMRQPVRVDAAQVDSILAVLDL